MANINGNNIDDLFRQASDKYPLRTDSSDWGKLSDALDNEPSLVQPIWSGDDERRGKRRLLWLLLLLLPVTGAGYLIWQTGSHGKVSGAVGPDRADATSGVARNPGVHTTGNVARTATSTGTVAPASTGHTVVPTGHVNNDADHPALASTASGMPHQTAGRSTVGGMHPNVSVSSRGPDHHAAFGAHPAYSGGTQPDAGLTQSGYSGGTQPDHSGVAQSGYSAGTQPDHSGGTRSDAPGMTNGGSMGGRPYPGASLDKDPLLAWLDLDRAMTSDGMSLRLDVDAANHQPPLGHAANNGKGKAVVKLRPEHHAYLGLFAAPDLSTIHMQRVSTVGTTYGILLGYTLNNRWSLESGLSIDHKNYYTEGQYFNKAKVPQLNYIDLKKVDGACNMLELPVNLRYNLGAGEKVKWFATAGLSSYFMSSEWYDYQGWSTTGTGGWVNHASAYHTPSQNWFSIVNLSIGYEQRLGRIGNLRLEPYLRVPLSGMGTGSLPIMSAGLNVGITRRIW